MWRTASTKSAVLAPPFVRIMAAPAQVRGPASPRLRAPQTNGTSNPLLLAWNNGSAGVRTSDSSIMSTPRDSSARASASCPIRHFAITGTVTASMISWILTGSAIRATPPAARMSAGTRSRAMTATAPASSAISACSAFVTSITTPPFCIFAKPRLSSSVPNRSLLRSRSRGMMRLGRELRADGYFYVATRVPANRMHCLRQRNLDVLNRRNYADMEQLRFRHACQSTKARPGCPQPGDYSWLLPHNLVSPLRLFGHRRDGVALEVRVCYWPLPRD